MPWFDNVLQRIKAPFTPDPAALDAHAVTLFAQSAKASGHDTQEFVWITNFIGRMRDVQARNAEGAWLRAVDNHGFLLDATDKIVHSLKTALIVDSKPSVVNARKVWTEFVGNAIVQHTWDISRWKNRKQWFDSILGRGWHDAKEGNQAKLDYASRMAGQHLWARDELLAYRALNIRATDDLDIMFSGASTTSLSFITALSTIVLRMNQKAPTVAVARLHRQAHAAWPMEMVQLEATMQAQAIVDGTTVQNTASLARSMELGDKGYSAYFVIFGQGIHSLIQTHFLNPIDQVELPALD